MQKYTDVVTSSRSGAAIPDLRVTVKTYPAGATATIYSDDGITEKANPLTTDDNGEFWFYAADGDYTLTVSGGSITSRTIGPVTLLDPDDDDLLASSNVGFTPSGSGAVARSVQAVLRDYGKLVTDFGATGDGTTNDSAAIQAAITAAVNAGGGYVIFPPASSGYSIGTAISMSFTADKDVSVTLIGFGKRSRLVAASGSGIDMITLTNTVQNARRVHFRGLFLNLNNTATAGIVLNNCSYDTVENCEFANIGTGKGVKLTGICGGIRVTEGFFFEGSSSGTGVSIEDTSVKNHVSDCYFGESLPIGVSLASGTSENKVADCTFFGVSTAVAINASHRNTVTDNIIDETGSHGITITSANRNQITNNTIRDYGSEANQQNGIFINTAGSVDADDNVIRGNTIIEANAEGNSAHIRIAETSGASNRTLVENNDLDSSATVAIQDAGTSTRIRNNRGYVTENNGTATVANATTSIAVTHGLSTTPALDDISVTPTNDLGNATKFWISTPTSTQFTINVDADPGAGTATFVWTASIQ